MSPDNSKHSRRRNQAQEVLGELVRAHGRPVAAWVLARISLQYNARIHELRKLGFSIISEVKVVDGVKHGYFLLVTGPAALTTSVAPTTEQTEPGKLFADGEAINHNFDLEHLPD